ncbi:tRNA (adenosine(37)-N6)-threonylcarbamoyltransferase complex dimerization subunit type 1 TsaB [Mycoplasma sp. HF11B]|uniref:tRNA (adenosine(37)-N6)-threonylcarbamoyltransferase complex dimerization subunit type 1 TsaB n=1 Tax=unclassified Mycoplasma TaxID=2683645 RepID=UPI003AAE791A
MNVYLDTSSEDFVLVLFNQEFEVLDFILLEGYKKKVQLITDQFAILLERNNLSIQQLDGLYTNIGPGFFTGIRSSLVFFRTLALLNNIKMYVTTSMDILRLQHPHSNYLWSDAQGNKLYQYNYEIDSNNYHDRINVVENNGQELTKINFVRMINDFETYAKVFKFQETMSIEPLYIKQPQIGGQK